MTARPTARLLALRRLLVPNSLSQPDEFSMADYQAIRRIVAAALVCIVAGLLAFGGSRHGAVAQQFVKTTGIALIAAGIIGRLWAILYIGGRKSLEVVQAGPYSMTRNPLYLSSTLAAAGVGAQGGTLTAALVAALLCGLSFQLVIRFEERYLVDELGEAYRDYMRRVPRFWPRPSLYRDAGALVADPRILRRTMRDAVMFLAAIPLFGLIGAAQEAGLAPVLFRLW
jgi:protein-S-isoprenylcysteine O-methyltransferase Ste14